MFLIRYFFLLKMFCFLCNNISLLIRYFVILIILCFFNKIKNIINFNQYFRRDHLPYCRFLFTRGLINCIKNHQYIRYLIVPTTNFTHYFYIQTFDQIRIPPYQFLQINLFNLPKKDFFLPHIPKDLRKTDKVFLFFNSPLLI